VRQIRCKAEADGIVRMGEGLAYRRILSTLSRGSDRVIGLSLKRVGYFRIALLLSPSQASQDQLN